MKKIIRLVLVLLYLGALMVSLLIAIKPGAAIFYIKHKMEPQVMVNDWRFAYRYRLDISARFIRTQGILMYENGQPLTQTNSNAVANTGNNTYAINVSPEGATYIYFSSSDNSDPTTNGRTYTLYLPLTFISRSFGLLCLFFLLLLVVRFAEFALIQKNQRRLITTSPGGILQVLDNFFDDSLPGIPADMHGLWQEKAEGAFGKHLFTILVLVAYLYIFMEWLFLVTMPSFMSLMSFFSKAEIFILSGLAFSIFCMLMAVAFVFLDFLILIAHQQKITHHLELIIPSIVLSSLALLLVDNFTYTIFRFGIINSTGIVRGVYGLFFVLITGYIYFKILSAFGLRGNAPRKKNTKNPLFFSSLGIVVISLGLAVARLNYNHRSGSDINLKTIQASTRPNIILLGSDGLSANHFSVYGYGRDTTPRLSQLAQTSLVADNAFSNASKTAGSIVALMTSKYPTETRVMFPPNILTGQNAFQHLPGILKDQGYVTIEFGTPYFVDAYSYNFQNAFDMVNNRTEDQNSLHALGQKLGYDSEVYFLYLVNDRILSRIQHILFLGQMQNPYAIVTHPAQSISDEQKISQTLNLLDNTKKPLFIHLHLLGTHGPRYEPPRNVFSAGETQNEDWMADFYDDTILAFDQYIGTVIDHLKAHGQLDNTVLIIYTDHNYQYQVNERIPLIIHFPFDQHSGRIKSNVENIDIAPTVVDYLGIPIPKWMEGTSLLRGAPAVHRLIIGSTLSNETINEDNANELDMSQLKPPFYQFSYLDIIDCQKWYTLNLVDMVWSSGEVPGYTYPCSQNGMHSLEEIKQAAIDRLTKDGFDTSSIH